MARMINIGFGNLVNATKIIAVVSPDAAPVRRLIQNAKEKQICVDATQGRKTKAVLVMETDMIVLSALVPDTIARRIASGSMPGERMEQNGSKDCPDDSMTE